MEDIQYYLAIAAVVVAGYFIIKKISSCIINAIIGVIVLAVLLWGLDGLGIIDIL